MRRLLLACAAVAVAACTGADAAPLEISDARVGVPTGPNAAAYLTVTSGADDRLIAADTESAGRVELHETTMGEDGSMSMSPVESFSVTAAEGLVLEPGGKHLMLLDVDSLDLGDTVELALEFENADRVEVSAVVVEPADAMGDDG